MNIKSFLSTLFIVTFFSSTAQVIQRDRRAVWDQDHREYFNLFLEKKLPGKKIIYRYLHEYGAVQIFDAEEVAELLADTCVSEYNLCRTLWELSGLKIRGIDNPYHQLAYRIMQHAT